jgi:alkylation response protein AidB-like acyl-CoA dehydrogenase
MVSFTTERHAPDHQGPRYALPRSADPLAAVRKLAPMVEKRAAAAAANARVDDEVIDALVASGTMTLMVPAVLGGGEADPSVQLEVIEELSHADGSTGWAAMATMTSMGTFLSLLSDAGVDAVLGSQNYLCAGAVAPPGRARQVDGGYVLSGRFSFGSGGAHAGWFIGGYALIDSSGSPVLTELGSPRVLFAIVPREQVNLLGNWDVVGLVATASHDYEVPEQFVPNELVAPGERSVRGGALYHMGLKSLPGTGHAAVALGIARRSLDEFAALSGTKSRPPSGLLNKHPEIQRDFAVWRASLRSSRAFVHEAFTTLFEATREGRELTSTMKADCRLAATHAVYQAAEVVRNVYLAAGSVGLRNGSVIQRNFLDAHAATQHLFTGAQIYIEAGRIYLDTPGLTAAHTELMTTTFAPPLT